MKRLCVFVGLAAVLGYGVSTWAADAQGCKDHPLFSRMANYEIFHCAAVEFDEVAFPKPELKEWANPEDYTKAEGKIFAISYKLKDGAQLASSLQILRNFQNAVKGSGGTVMGDYEGAVYPPLPSTAAKYLGDSSAGLSYDRYTTMTLTKNGSEFWMYLGAAEAYQGYVLLLVEKQAMQQEISVNELEKQLNKDGFLTYHFNFDTGKSVIKPENQDSINQIAALLKASATLKVSIEGHTDNVGTPESNLKLSEDRARAVMTAVAAKGIAADRMTAVGHGQEKPVADNRKEDGRAQNRRVEVVKK